MRNGFWMERVNGIEPSSSAWEAEVMPLYDTRFSAKIVSKKIHPVSAVTWAAEALASASRS